ncbi:hypothetical protein [Microbacterium allomyrinae]|uniref:Uncharacterized protein n=1 Tax=Microbacterium allomyrinae TaxID=2830666 RepID=A0A9X1LUD9_9MICO|nr:hypothetical protein [Microbacterium allomyrinae]MCC2032184.1 hypothetical protein [Microbacterium allomyrinae]
MSTRARPAVLDGLSVEADASIDAETKAKVEVVVLDILRVAGASTDDVIVALYESRVEHFPGVPRVTPQRVRTARAACVRRGLVGAHPTPGTSRVGNRATRWQLTVRKDA